MLFHRMRMLGVLLAVALLVAAQDEAPKKKKVTPEHDVLGFPLSFNGETLTRQDIVRELGVADESAIGSMRSARDRVLREKLEARIGDLLGFAITDDRLKSILEGQIDKVGSEYEYYEKLEQQGETRAGHEASLRKRVMRWFIQGRLNPDLPTALIQPLPYDLDARPREVRIAYEHDGKGRFKDTVSARVIVIVLELSEKERGDIVRKNFEDLDEADRQIAGKIQAKLDAVLEKLKAGVPFEKVARDQGGDVENAKNIWRDLPTDPGDNPIYKFILSAEAGQTSKPISYSSGGYRLVHVIEIKKLLNRDISDPEVYDYYRTEIRAQRRAKAQARLLLRALDSSSIRPKRVQADLREGILAELELASQGLAALGLH
jgi:parvulin-like peptidyl-prolyl isomerase